MIALLQTIVDFFVCWVQTGVTNFANAVILDVAYVIGALAALLPNLPDYPSLPSWFDSGSTGNVLGWVAWVFPVHQAVLVFAFILSAWLIWQIVQMAMRWARMLT